MKIAYDVLSEIINAAEGIEYEIGGILGSSDSVYINHIYIDNIQHKSKFNYYPNTDLFNSIIKQWAENGIDFKGIFHTHFYAVDTLSEFDIDYITHIMCSLDGIVNCLYFPLFILPQKELVVYKALNTKNNITIMRENLYIC